MTRTSPAEVRGLFRRLVKAAGATASDWRLLEGNETFGIYWSLMAGEEQVVLGATPQRAALFLSGMVRALELVPAREPVGSGPFGTATRDAD